MSDPPVAGDGRCYMCGKERPPIAVKNGDPFCTRDCCEVWYAPAARRFDFFPQVGRLVDSEGPFAFTRQELDWLIRTVAPRLAGRLPKSKSGAE